jgi:hypothetical protein
MVDITTIKPGQKLRYIGEDGSLSGSNTPIQKGEEYAVTNDGTNIFYVDHSGVYYVSILIARSLCCFMNVAILEHVGDVAGACDAFSGSCVCDIIALMSRGCQCGHIQREREGAR